MLCYNCMRDKGGADVCPYCGTEYIPDTAVHHLPAGTVIGGRYTLGRVLGEGGFGITYIGLHHALDVPVAVKEYYPYGFSHRAASVSSTVSVSAGEYRELFEKGKRRFLSEAKNVARFRNEPGVVNVIDFIEENNTAYIVMEYLDGVDLRRYLRDNGRMTAAQTLSLIKPVIRTLGKMHSAGIIHRDISPDNLMFQPDGSLKLMDFGAARDFDGETRSMSVMLKQGYAPAEQYLSSGKQGPWTDVYGICATIYRCITGKTPIEALERMAEDRLEPPSRLGADISPAAERVLLYGLAVKREDRCQSMSELYRLFCEAEQEAAVPPAEIKPEVPDDPVTDDPQTIPVEEEPAGDMTVLADDTIVSDGMTVLADEDNAVDHMTVPAEADAVIAEAVPTYMPQGSEKTVLIDETGGGAGTKTIRRRRLIPFADDSDKRRSLISALLLLGAAAVWGLSYIMGRDLAVLVNPFALNAFRFVTIFIVLIPAVIISRRVKKQKLFESSKADRRGLIISSLICGVLLFAFMTVFNSIPFRFHEGSSAEHFIAVFPTYFLFVPLFALTRRRRPGARAIIALALAFVGTFLDLVLMLRYGCELEPIWLSLGGNAVFAVHILLIDRFSKKHDPLKLCALQFLFAGILSTIGMLITAPSYFGADFRRVFGDNTLTFMIYALGAGALGYLLMILGQRLSSDPVRAALLMNTESVFAVLGTVILTDCQFNDFRLMFWLTCLLIAAAAAVVLIPFRKRGERAGKDAS